MAKLIVTARDATGVATTTIKSDSTDHKLPKSDGGGGT